MNCPPEEEGGDVVDLPLGAPLAAHLVDPVEDVLAELLVLEGVLLELGVAVPDDAEQLQDGLADVQVAATKKSEMRTLLEQSTVLCQQQESESLPG